MLIADFKNPGVEARGLKFWMKSGYHGYVISL
jgi:hypothetical protein